MFNNSESEKSEMARKDLIIVCDESTKTVAKDLSNDVAHKYTCCVWNKQQYRDNEPRLTNKNKVLFLDTELKEENLGRVKDEVNLGFMTYFKVRGNQIGIYKQCRIAINCVHIIGMNNFIEGSIEEGCKAFKNNYLDAFMKGELR